MFEGAAERDVVPGVDGNLGCVEDIAQCQGIRRRPVETDVAADGRDSDEVGMAKRKSDCDSVIESGITVEYDTRHCVGGRHRSTVLPIREQNRPVSVDHTDLNQVLPVGIAALVGASGSLISSAPVSTRRRPRRLAEVGRVLGDEGLYAMNAGAVE